MKQFNWLGLWFVIGLIAVITVGVSTVGYCTEITFENCQAGTWVGGVRWLDNKTSYEDVPELELKGVGSLVVDLSKGEYAITHYRPSYLLNGTWFPSAIIDFREIKVSTFNATHSFGCGG